MAYEAHPLVGRDPVLADVRGAVQRALTGRGGLLLVTGEAGIGKTALAAETAAYARSAGAAVGWAACSADDGAPGFWPWLQIFRSLGDPGAFERVGAEAGRLALFDEVTASLLTAASRRPLVLVLDDLQWADPDSLALLAFAARRLPAAPVLALGAYRDAEVGEPARRHLAEASTQASTIQLAGLTAAGVARLMESILGRSPPAELSARIRDRTAGNPFFVQELTRLLQSRHGGAAGFDGTAPVISAGVREVIERRLARLGQNCVRVLRAASVAGHVLDLDLLQRLTGMTRAELLPHLREAAGARVLTGPPSYRFVHELFIETLDLSLAPAERCRLHERVAAALEERLRSGGDVAPAAIAHHHLRAADDIDGGGSARRAVELLLRAADEAESRLAFGEAAGHYGTVIGLLEAEPLEAARPLSELALRHGEALHRSGQAEPARAAFLRAAALARRAADVSTLASAALGVHAVGSDRWALADDTLALLDEALAARGDRPDELTARLLAAMARQAAWSGAGNGERAEALARRAVRQARDAGDPGTLGRCLLALHNALWRPGTAIERLALTEEIVALAGGDEELEIQGRQLRAVALLEVADAGAAAALSDFVQRAERSRQPSLRWLGRCARAFQAALRGDLAAADRMAAEAGELGRQIGEPDWRNVLCTQTWEVRRAQGRARELVRTLDGEPSAPGFLESWLAPVAVLAGHEEGEPAGTARDRIRFPPDPDTPGWAWFLPRIYLAEVAAALGMAAECRQLYRELLPHAGACVVEGALVRFPGSVSLYLGLLARTVGDLDAAVTHLERALDVHRRLEARMLEARTACELAVTLLDAGQADRANELLEAATDQATACGATALARRAAERFRARRPAAAGFRRDGDVWELSFGDRTVRLPDARGLADIAALLAAPGRPLKAADLAAASGARALARRVGLGADLVLDEQARREYRSRLDELAREVEEAERDGDLERGSRALAERQELLDHLAAATGMGGRRRRLGSESERARKAVTARVHDSLRRIELAHPDLGRHLRESIRTGGSCAYLPRQPVDWRLV